MKLNVQIQQCGRMQYSTLQNVILQKEFRLKYDTIEYNKICCSILQYHIMQSTIVQYNIKQNNNIKYRVVQYYITYCSPVF